jgi:hypothetical protein
MEAMGINARLVDIELTVSSDRIRFLTVPEMQRLRLVTGGNQFRVERRRQR